MTDRLLDILKGEYSLTELDAGEFASMKVGGMKFSIKAFDAPDLGHISLMKASGYLGLMKMDTLMIVPKEKDLPLYSYDRIYAMGNDTLIVELYDTLTSPLDLSALDSVKANFTHLAERDPGEHWYDDIKLPQSISKKGKKAQSGDFDKLTLEHFKAYLTSDAPDVSDKERKLSLSQNYVHGLLEKGGPSTDVFKKNIGTEKTALLFKKVLFGTE